MPAGAGQVAEILKPRGYRPAPKDGWSILYEKAGVFVRLEFDDGKISALTVFVESTNVEDVSFWRGACAFSPIVL